MARPEAKTLTPLHLNPGQSVVTMVPRLSSKATSANLTITSVPETHPAISGHNSQNFLTPRKRGRQRWATVDRNARQEAPRATRRACWR